MDKLKTATGHEFDCDYFNPFPLANQVNLRVLGVNMVRAAIVFSNPNETDFLWCGSQTLSKHTKLLALIPEDDAIRVVLAKEE